MKKRLLLVVCIVVLFCGGCIGETDYYELNSSDNTSIGNQEDGASSTTTTSEKDGTEFEKSKVPSSTNASASGTVQNATTKANENVADGGALFDTTASGSAMSTTTQTTTLKPAKTTQVVNIVLPQTGYDPDGKGRIQVGEVSVVGSQLSLQLKNVTSKWMTEETSSLEYTCYDKAGKELKKDTWIFGALEAGKSCTREITLPAHTAQVRITQFKAVYWTQWK